MRQQLDVCLGSETMKKVVELLTMKREAERWASVRVRRGIPTNKNKALQNNSADPGTRTLVT